MRKETEATRRPRAAHREPTTASTAPGTGTVPVIPLRDRHGAREIPTRAMLRAVPAWLGLTWLSCYLLGPALLALGTSEGGGVLLTGVLTAPAYAATTLTATVLATASRPRVRLHRRGFEPVAWAALGWLATWAVIHNTSTLLQPFARMPLDTLGGFLLLNGVEAGLIGAMLGTLTRSRRRAFALGAAFQGMQMSLSLLILSALP